MSTTTTLRTQLAPPEPATDGTHDPVLCFAANDNTLGLKVNTDNDVIWCFPYSHFLCSDLTHDLLTIRFATHLVLVRGSNLEVLVDELVAQHLAMIRVLPKRQRGQIEHAGVWIENLRVQPLTSKDSD